jgi:hypothetical protein
VVLDCCRIVDVDGTACRELRGALASYREVRTYYYYIVHVLIDVGGPQAGVHLLFAALPGPVRDTLERYGLADAAEAESMRFLSLAAAIASLDERAAEKDTWFQRTQAQVQVQELEQQQSGSGVGSSAVAPALDDTGGVEEDSPEPAIQPVQPAVPVSVPLPHRMASFRSELRHNLSVSRLTGVGGGSQHDMRLSQELGTSATAGSTSTRASAGTVTGAGIASSPARTTTGTTGTGSLPPPSPQLPSSGRRAAGSGPGTPVPSGFTLTPSASATSLSSLGVGNVKTKPWGPQPYLDYGRGMGWA